MPKQIEQWEGCRAKLHNDALPYRTICFGFDQSYTNTGIAIAGITYKKQIDILHCESIGGGGGGIESKFEFRKRLTNRVAALMRKYRASAENCYALCEAVRVHKDGNMSINNHLSWGALQGCLSDLFYQRYDILLRIVDTRAWKSKVVGTSKPAEHAPPSVDPKKWPTIEYVMHVHDIPKEQIAWPLGPRTRNYAWIDADGNKFTFNSDICDACCIAIYGLMFPMNKLKLAP